MKLQLGKPVELKHELRLPLIDSLWGEREDTRRAYLWEHLSQGIVDSTVFSFRDSLRNHMT